MYVNRHAAKLSERQHLKKVRKYYVTIAEINVALNAIVMKLRDELEHPNFNEINDYVNKYVSHTTIWNLKFAMNFESPEIALLQILQLENFFEQAPIEKYIIERATFEQQRNVFFSLDAYSEEQIDKRRSAMFNLRNTNE